MRKIGILTFHRAHNYGAVLQCFALQEAVKKIGGNVVVVDYTPTTIIKSYSYGFPSFAGKKFLAKIKVLASFILIGRRRYKRYKLFNKFIETHLHLTNGGMNKFEDNTAGLDIILYGSDQIWNDYITMDDSHFFGDEFSGKKIAYAASAGKGDSIIKKHIKQLQTFDSLGVREKSLSETLLALGFKNIIVNIDPTLLLTKIEWESFFNLRKRNCSSKYVLVYALRDRDRVVEMARNFAKGLGLKMIEIGATVTFSKPANRLDKVDPIEFLSYIYNAEYVVTTSFHGTVFSILFKKDFFTVKLNDGEDGRAENLLSALSLEDRLRHVGDSLNTKKVDYITSDILLDELRKKSYKYLKSTLHL